MFNSITDIDHYMHSITQLTCRLGSIHFHDWPFHSVWLTSVRFYLFIGMNVVAIGYMTTMAAKIKTKWSD